MKAKIGLIQVKQEAKDLYAERTQKLLDAAEACFLEGADLVFFPEAYQHVPDRTIIYRPKDLAEVNREWKHRCSALAKKYHAYLVPWDYELADDGRVYNSSYILDREGREIGRYRKVHLTHSEQTKGLSNGTDFPVFDLDFGKVGIMICFDNYFPESARILGNRGAQLVLYPLYGDTLFPQWELKMRARAIDNSMYVAPCRIDSRCTDIVFTGLVSPEGTVLHRLDSQPAHLVVDVDMDREVKTQTTGMREYTENIRSYLDRCHRPDAYVGLLEMPPVKDWETVFYGKVPDVMTKEQYEKTK
ncbi:MAG: carbon-nitrogen hydrolase family protein [Clostridia bacterium]|nr:carbon-nitrogen hydrolase family protein [Clostridia bacterium]